MGMSPTDTFCTNPDTKELYQNNEQHDKKIYCDISKTDDHGDGFWPFLAIASRDFANWLASRKWHSTRTRGQIDRSRQWPARTALCDIEI